MDMTDGKGAAGMTRRGPANGPLAFNAGTGMRAAAVVATLAWAGPALACMPGGLTPTGPVQGPHCSVTQVADEVMTVGLGVARDLTNGVVVQRTVESDGCGQQQTLVVMLCGTGQASVLGTEAIHVMLPPEELKNQGALDALEAWVQQAARTKMMLTPEVLAAEASKRGLALALTLPASGKIKMAGKRFSLACGCKTYYPGL